MNNSSFNVHFGPSIPHYSTAWIWNEKISDSPELVANMVWGSHYAWTWTQEISGTIAICSTKMWTCRHSIVAPTIILGNCANPCPWIMTLTPQFSIPAQMQSTSNSLFSLDSAAVWSFFMEFHCWFGHIPMDSLARNSIGLTSLASMHQKGTRQFQPFQS